jgi:hypothetical protein
MRKKGRVAISCWVAKEVPMMYMKGTTVRIAKVKRKITLKTSNTLDAGESFRLMRPS